jgi:SdpC family antimicrobial peptide
MEDQEEIVNSRLRKIVVAVTTSSVIVAGGVTAQSAFASGDTGVSAPGKAQLKETTKSTAQYTDAELLQLLLAGQGVIADTHPELKQMLGFNPEKPHTTVEALNQVISGYLAAHPGFHESTAVPFHSGDPVRVDAALRDFSVSFIEWAKSTQPAGSSGTQAQAQASGWFYMGAYVAIYVNAVGAANAAVYTNAGIATNALATLVVVTWYLEDGSPSGSGIERDAFVNALTSALS